MINQVFSNEIYQETSGINKRVENFIKNNSLYKIFATYIKIEKVLEKKTQDELNDKYIVFVEASKIISNYFTNYVKENSDEKILKVIGDILKNNGEEVNGLQILNKTIIESKTYTSGWKILYKTNIEYINNGEKNNIILNVYFNGDIGVYYRPQENVENGFLKKDIIINTEKGRIGGTLYYKENIDNLIIITTGGGEVGRDFLVSRHRINIAFVNILNKLGYNVFVYDKASVGFSSGKGYLDSTTLDSSKDLSQIINYFKKNNKHSKKIGLIGHSEGGLISILSAEENNVDFIILISAPYGSLKELVNDGSINLGSNLAEFYKDDIKEIMQNIFKIIEEGKNTISIRSQINIYKNSLSLKKRLIFEAIDKSLPFGDTNDLSKDWFKYYLSLDIKKHIGNLNIPILIINGDNDFIINHNRLNILQEYLKNSNSGIQILENTGHMLENNITRTNNDYSKQISALNPDIENILDTFIKKVN